MATASRRPLAVVDKHLWMKCAGHLPFDPSVGSLVYFFPQGYVDSAGKSQDLVLKHRIEEILEHKEAYLCQILAINLLADEEYEEVFSRIKLKTVDFTSQYNTFEREENQEGFFIKTLTPTDVERSLYLPIPILTENAVIPPTITLTDLHHKTWAFTQFIPKGKDGVGLKGWTKFIKEKKLRSGDTVIFQKTKSEHISVAFQRKDNSSAKKYVNMLEDYAMDGFLFSSAVQANIGDEFEVMYYPHWVEFLVHPSVLRDSKSKLSRNMRVRKSNPQNSGPYFVGGTLLELNSSNSLKWEDSTVHWDGETEESLINHWQIQPETDPIPGRNKHRRFKPHKPRRSKNEASTLDIEGTEAEASTLVTDFHATETILQSDDKVSETEA